MLLLEDKLLISDTFTALTGFVLNGIQGDIVVKGKTYNDGIPS